MNENQSVTYEMILTAEEARQGTTKLLPRNNRRLQVNIPAGVTDGSVVKLSNALQVTDGRPGDILLQVKIKRDEPADTGTAPAGVVEIDDNSFESEVLRESLPVVVDFWAPWCGPCRMMAPIMDRLAVQYRGRFKFCKINVDQNPVMASRYQAMSIPLLLFFKNGQVIDRSVGAVPESHLKTILDSHL